MSAIRLLIVSIIAASVIMASGCTSVSRGLGKITANKYSEARSGTNWIIAPPQLDPPGLDERTVYISFRNLSDADLDLTPQLRAGASAQGWNITNDPNAAEFRLRGDLRFFGEVEPESGGLGAAAGMGIISGAAGGLAAYAIADEIMSNSAAGIVGGVGGGLMGLGMANASKPREWAMILDFVLEEKSDEPVEFVVATDASSIRSDVSGASNSRMASGGNEQRGNSSYAETTKTSDYFPHGIRLSAWTNQMNMSEVEAMPELIYRVENVVGRILPQ